MDVGLDPEQPEAVSEAVAEALAGPDRGPDPWWQAGIDENLS